MHNKKLLMVVKEENSTNTWQLEGGNCHQYTLKKEVSQNMMMFGTITQSFQGRDIANNGQLLVPEKRVRARFGNQQREIRKGGFLAGTWQPASSSTLLTPWPPFTVHVYGECRKSR
jgi:hypothetical protein